MIYLLILNGIKNVHFLPSQDKVLIAVKYVFFPKLFLTDVPAVKL